VSVSLGQARALQQIRGEHLVRPDGTVFLGSYGSVPVAGLTLDAAKAQIEAFLSSTLLRPQVSVDVASYNSKVYYVITNGAGFGETVYRLPITGNETVLDAIGQVYGLPGVASLHRIYLVRPGPANCEDGEIHLHVDWKAITQKGITETNYQLFPGDRIYIHGDALITWDAWLGKMINPMERLFGVTLLGSTTVHEVGHPGSTQGNNGR
jgi:protein involved in polysaccharide export with SLBB domain